MFRKSGLNYNFVCRAAIVPALACSGLAGLALAQNGNQPAGRFVVLPPHLQDVPGSPSAPLATWNGSFTFQGQTYNYNMVGAAPTTGTSTTIQVYIIPIKIVVAQFAFPNGQSNRVTFDPSHVLPNGKTVIENTATSPIFDSTTQYVQGGVDVGTTQYIDAFQRANFWGVVKTHKNYHVLFNPTVLAEQTLDVPPSQGTTGEFFGFEEGLVNINWFDGQLQNIIHKLSVIQPNSLPIFLTYNVYLTSGGCCIGGYHSAEGSAGNPQAYAMATYVDQVGAFSQDVSALSHESGEFVDDPLVKNFGNPVPCGILEVGDPLEGNPNFGGYQYVLNGFTYNLQDLVTLPYFGAIPSTSVNGFFTFQGENLSVCQNGG